MNVPISLVVHGLPQLTLSGANQIPVTFTSQTSTPAIQTLDLTVVAQIRNVTVQVNGGALTPAGGSGFPVTPATGITPLPLHILLNPAGLTAGSYQGQITIVSSDAGNSPFVVPVNLFILAPQAMSVLAIANGASFIAGAGAPNTIMSAFGVFPGCDTGAQVVVDGKPGSVFGSTTSQINFLVPPEAAGKTSVAVQFLCAGIASTAVPLQVLQAAPALFTSSQTGAGQASAINQDWTLAPPSPAGTIVSLYGTGFGALGLLGKTDWRVTLPEFAGLNRRSNGGGRLRRRGAGVHLWFTADQCTHSREHSERHESAPPIDGGRCGNPGRRNSRHTVESMQTCRSCWFARLPYSGCPLISLSS